MSAGGPGVVLSVGESAAVPCSTVCFLICASEPVEEMPYQLVECEVGQVLIGMHSHT